MKHFSYAKLCGVYGQHCIGFSAVKFCPKSTKREHCTKFFRTEFWLEHFGQHCIGFSPAQDFFMQFELVPLGQYCIGFLPVQFCPKIIEENIAQNFFYKRLSGASWTTLHKVFTCAMLPQEY